jgi:hypothetical protein
MWKPAPDDGESYFTAAKIKGIRGLGFNNQGGGAVVADKVPTPGALWMLGPGLRLVVIRRKRFRI